MYLLIVNSRQERKEARIKQRMRDAFLMGLRAREFTEAEMLTQASHLIEFARKIHKQEVKK